MKINTVAIEVTVAVAESVADTVVVTVLAWFGSRNENACNIIVQYDDACAFDDRHDRFPDSIDGQASLIAAYTTFAEAINAREWKVRIFVCEKE